MAKLPILMYHHVCVEKGKGLTISVENLEKQFKHLAENNYKTYHFNELLQMKELPKISPNYLSEAEMDEEEFLAYKRDEKLVRKWVSPGIKGKQHRIGGLEKELETGNVSYDPDNHQKMTEIRAEKVALIADFISS